MRSKKEKSLQIVYRTRVSLLTYLPGMHYLEVPKKIVRELGSKLPIRLWCTVNGDVKFQCGILGIGEGNGAIYISKKRLKQLGVRQNEMVRVELRPDKSKYGMPLPEELKELLKQDQEAKERFDKLTPGKQRYIIHYVSTVKNPELRLERAILLINNLKTLPLGKETMRGMLGLPPIER